MRYIVYRDYRGNTTNHFYNADTYNEITSSSNDYSFLAAINKAIYQAMVDVDLDTRLAVSQKQVVHTLMYAQIHKSSLTYSPKDLQRNVYTYYHICKHCCLNI